MCEMEAGTTAHSHPVENEKKKGNNNYQSESGMQNYKLSTTNDKKL